MDRSADKVLDSQRQPRIHVDYGEITARNPRKRGRVAATITVASGLAMGGMDRGPAVDEVRASRPVSDSQRITSLAGFHPARITVNGTPRAAPNRPRR